MVGVNGGGGGWCAGEGWGGCWWMDGGDGVGGGGVAGVLVRGGVGVVVPCHLPYIVVMSTHMAASCKSCRVENKSIIK